MVFFFDFIEKYLGPLIYLPFYFVSRSIVFSRICDIIVSLIISCIPVVLYRSRKTENKLAFMNFTDHKRPPFSKMIKYTVLHSEWRHEVIIFAAAMFIISVAAVFTQAISLIEINSFFKILAVILGLLITEIVGVAIYGSCDALTFIITYLFWSKYHDKATKDDRNK